MRDTSKRDLLQRPQLPATADRLKTFLLIAAALASILVGVVAARSLFLSAEKQVSPAQAAR